MGGCQFCMGGGACGKDSRRCRWRFCHFARCEASAAQDPLGRNRRARAKAGVRPGSQTKAFRLGLLQGCGRRVVQGRQVPSKVRQGPITTSILPRLRLPYFFDANLEMISAGLAWRYKQYQGEHSEEDRERYAAAEEAAQSRKAGLWYDTEPSPPWEWRKRKRLAPRTW
jgi:hypothetical protein